MKDIYKNPALYCVLYVLVPVAVALWPLLVWAVYLPSAEDNWQNEKAQYLRAQKIIEEILTLDRDRLDFAGSKDATGEFDYAVAVDKVASLFNINYTSNSKPIKVSGGQKTKNANVILKDVDIAGFANFLATIQFRWTNLQCERLTLRKKKGLRDKWDVNLEFKYYY